LKGYSKAFREALPEAFLKTYPKSMPNQEQEQEQDQEHLNINKKSEAEKNEQSVIDGLTKDSRKFFSITFEWIPNKEIFSAYCMRKQVTSQQLTKDILNSFVDTASAKGESKTEAEWCKCLAGYLASCLANPQKPKKPENQHYTTPPDIERIVTPPRKTLTPEEKAEIDRGMAELLAGFKNV
jgi:hypothetical protein